jgi:hypothetical protein
MMGIAESLTLPRRSVKAESVVQRSPGLADRVGQPWVRGKWNPTLKGLGTGLDNAKSMFAIDVCTTLSGLARPTLIDPGLASLGRPTLGSAARPLRGRLSPNRAGLFTTPRPFTLAAFLLIAAWLAAAAWLVQIEYYDGLSAIVNARFFLGNVDRYVADRAPMMAWLLVPAELVRTTLGLHTLDVRLYHIFLAMLHAAYLVLTYRLLMQIFPPGTGSFFPRPGSDIRRGLEPPPSDSPGKMCLSPSACAWLTLAAWAAAVPNFIFFSFSPFISHDILPGLLLLYMLVRCDRFLERPSYGVWLELVAVGAAAALMKQTFGIFWLLALLAALFQCARSRRLSKKGTGSEPHSEISPETSSGEAPVPFFLQAANRAAWTNLWGLACAAAASGIITWLALGCILGNTDPHSPLLIRPLRNLQYLAGVYEGKNVVFPLWIYLRNAPAYGWLALLLVVPGWVLSMRGTRLQQSIAIAWLGGLAFLHLLPLREVRYIAFLAPLTACLLVPALRFLAQWKLALGVALLVLAFDIGRCALEAAQVFDPFYTSGIERKFFDLLDDPERRAAPVFVNAPMLSFVSPIPGPLAADRYHRVFHFGVIHLRYLYDCRDLRILSDERGALGSISSAPEGSLLFYANRVLARGPSWSAENPIADAGFTQCVAICRSRAVTLIDADATDDGPADSDGRADRDSPADSKTVTLIRPSDGDERPLIIQGEPCAEALLGELLPVLRVDSTMASYWLQRTAPDAYAVPGMPPPTAGEPQTALIRRFEIDRRVGSKD